MSKRKGRKIIETVGIAAVITLIFQGPLLLTISLTDSSYLFRHYHLYIGWGIFLLTCALIVLVDTITGD